ncbi:MAG TPA: PEP-CTERM sorting domain-containing protein [Burkholderiaceae bacterium]|nr:PEP-CTERM sorting domain-containing protein [Burkholderiaceae bacterium]HRA63350.1 PEP-CTERM sorting domain-containing protein [Burkholderiaceae bacterium]
MARKRLRPPAIGAVAFAAALVAASPAALAASNVTSMSASGSYTLGGDAQQLLSDTYPPNFDSVDVLSFPYANGNYAGLHSYGSTSGNFGSRSSGYGIYDVTGAFRIVQTITNDSASARAATFNFFITPGLLSNNVGSALTGSDYVSAGLTFDIQVNGVSKWGSSATLSSTALTSTPQFQTTGTNLYSPDATGTYYSIAGGSQSIDLGVINAGESITLSYTLDTFARGSSTAGIERVVPEMTFHVPEQWVSCYGGNGYGYGTLSVGDGGCIDGLRLEPAHDVVVAEHTVQGTASSSHASSGDPFEIDFGSGEPRFDSYSKIDRYASGVVLAAVPEPSSYAMLLAGMGLVAWTVRRRRNAQLH